MIQIGNQTAFSAATLTEPFEYAVANGFDAFEWFPDKKPTGAGWDESDMDESLRWNIRETALTCGMRFSVHTRWQANPLRAASYPVLLEDLELATALGAALLNIHLYAEAGLAAYLGQAFRVVGTAERHAKIGGRYIDEVLIERCL